MIEAGNIQFELKVEVDDLNTKPKKTKVKKQVNFKKYAKGHFITISKGLAITHLFTNKYKYEILFDDDNNEIFILKEPNSKKISKESYKTKLPVNNRLTEIADCMMQLNNPTIVEINKDKLFKITETNN